MLTAILLTSLLATNMTSTNSANIRNNVQVRVNSEEAVMVHEQIQQNVQNRVQTRTELLEQKRTMLQERLQTLKDQNKQQVAMRVYTNQNDLNSKFVEKYNLTLSRLSDILTKLESAGADATLVAKATTAIETAQAAVDAQSDQVYTFEVTSEDNLGQTISTSISELRTDLTNVHNLVLAAKNAVIAVNASLNNNE